MTLVYDDHDGVKSSQWRWCWWEDSIDFLLGCDKATDSPAYVDVIGNNKKDRQPNKQKRITAISTHRLVHVIRSNGRVETHALTRISQFTLSVIFYCMVFFVFHGAALYVICFYMVWYVIAWHCYSVWHSNNQDFSVHLECNLLLHGILCILWCSIVCYMLLYGMVCYCMVLLFSLTFE